MENPSNHSFQRLGKEFEALRAEYRNGMPAKLEQLGTLWSRLASGSAEPQLVAELLAELRWIAGAADNFGLPQLSDAARAAASFLAEATAQGAKFGNEEERQFSRLLGELRRASLPPQPHR